jgi:hypothetical protein
LREALVFHGDMAERLRVSILSYQVVLNRPLICKSDVSGLRSFLYSPTKRARRGRGTEDRGQSVTGASRRKYYCLLSSVFCPLSFLAYHDGLAATWYQAWGCEADFMGRKTVGDWRSLYFFLFRLKKRVRRILWAMATIARIGRGAGANPDARREGCYLMSGFASLTPTYAGLSAWPCTPTSR